MSVTIINSTNIPVVPTDKEKAINIHVSYNSIKARLYIAIYNTSLVEAIEILRRAQYALGDHQLHPYINNDKTILIEDDTEEPNKMEVNNGK
jgi:hypothetical protein